MTAVLKTHQSAISKIYLVSGLGLLLLTGSFYQFGFKPLSNRLHAEHAVEIAHFLESSLWLVQGVLNKHIDLSRQSASRTAIRKKQAAYLRNKVSLDELRTFSIPKLADAVQANSEIVGIARFDPAGKLLFNVGQQLPGGIAERCDLSRLQAVRMLDPLQIDGKRRLLYCSPIVDKNAGRVGSDILIMKDDAIQRIVDAPQTVDSKVMLLGVANDGSIIYWTRKQGDAYAHQVLEHFIASNTIESGYIIQSKPVAGNGWRLYAVVNQERFFADINRQLLILLGVIFTIAVLLFVMTVLVLRPIIRTLLREQQLFEMSRHDGLTGLYNHGYMLELLDDEISRAMRYERPLSVLMFDLDHFKQVNDTYGHLVGDDVLRNIGQALKRSARQQDISARYGGEEFTIILPETDAAAAAAVAERLRADTASTKVTTEAGEISVTISIGIVSYDPSAGETTKHAILKSADQALYASKKGGRNRVTAVSLAA